MLACAELETREDPICMFSNSNGSECSPRRVSTASPGDCWKSKFPHLISDSLKMKL